MGNMIFTTSSIEEFKTELVNAIKKEILEAKESEEKTAKLAKTQYDDTVLLTRIEAAQFLKITLPTLKNWTDLGIIPGYYISSRVRYKKNELEASLQTVNAIKHKKYKS